jgi:hypothetical protein
MSVQSKSVVSSPLSSVVAFKPGVSSISPGPAPAVASEPESDWRLLGGVAFSILADLDRRRQKFAVTSPPAAQTKAA